MRAIALLVLYCATVLAPLGLASALGSPSRSFRDEIASGLGLLAFAMILVEFVLSGRFRSVSGGIGLDFTIRVHQLTARAALGFALLHPFLYAAPFAPALPWDVTRQLTLSTDIASLWSGIAAFVLLPAFVLMAIARSRLGWRYETWRLIHGLGALVIALMLRHHAIAAGRYSADPMLAGFWTALVAIAALSLLVVYVLKPLAQHFRPWRVTAIEPVGAQQWRLTIAPEGHPGLSYKAGQFVWLNVGHSPFSLYENPFSISSAPAAGPTLEFLIREAGDFTGQLGDVPLGTRAHLDGPHGTLHLDGHTQAPGIALIAGGVGLAPLIGILREHVHTADPRPLVLIDANRTREQIAFADELAEMQERANITVHHVLSDPAPDWTGATGFVDTTRLKSIFTAEQFSDWVFVICGPPPMMEAVETALLALGTPPAQILSERFQYD